MKTISFKELVKAGLKVVYIILCVYMLSITISALSNMVF